MVNGGERPVEAYMHEAAARAAARRRLPTWLALVMPFVALSFVFGATAACLLAAGRIHHWLHPTTTWANIGWVGFLIFAGSFIATTAPALILANLALWLVPPIRRILDTNAEGVKGLSFREGTRGLIKAARVMVPIGLGLVLIAMAL